MEDSKQIELAVKAGASLSTHLGNSVPLLLPRLPNIILDQLASKSFTLVSLRWNTYSGFFYKGCDEK